jgi:hypothetical protein|tara:strand:- start:1934 stop:2269 length:336 start_codon:yes stop_codon:yes gene_type:complete
MFEKESDDIKTSVTFFTTGDGSIHIDISLSDYDKDTMKSFAKLVSSLTLPQIQLETITMAKEGLLADGNDEACEEFLVAIAENSIKQKLFTDNSSKNKEENEPCIKPSDML